MLLCCAAAGGFFVMAEPSRETCLRDSRLARDSHQRRLEVPSIRGASVRRSAETRVRDDILRGRRIVGALVGGVPDTQALLDHCGKHSIVSDIELIAPEQINAAYERTLKGDVKYRFVIDCTTI